jgi:hypothetical protein
MMSNLLPCPFCGNSELEATERVVDTNTEFTWGVDCCVSNEIGFFETEKEAINHWNTRHQAAAPIDNLAEGIAHSECLVCGSFTANSNEAAINKKMRLLEIENERLRALIPQPAQEQEKFL